MLTPRGYRQPPTHTLSGATTTATPRSSTNACPHLATIPGPTARHSRANSNFYHPLAPKSRAEWGKLTQETTPCSEAAERLGQSMGKQDALGGQKGGMDAHAVTAGTCCPAASRGHAARDDVVSAHALPAGRRRADHLTFAAAWPGRAASAGKAVGEGVRMRVGRGRGCVRWPWRTGRGDGPLMWALCLVLAAVLSSLVDGQATSYVDHTKAAESPSMQPLLGGHLYWTVDKNFMAGGRNRKVKLTLLSAFEMDDRCTYTVGSAIDCKSTNGAADVHGILCVKMIKHDTNDLPQVVTAHIDADGKLGECPYVWDSFRPSLSAEDQAKCKTQGAEIDNWKIGIKCHSNVHPALTTVGGKGYRGTASGQATGYATVGTENDFTTLAVHVSESATVRGRKVNGRKVVFGAKTHMLIVPEDVTGVVAYLAGVNGTVIDHTQGMLLPPCEARGENKLILADTPVMCSHNTMQLREEGSIKSNGFHSGADVYWKDFLSDATVPVAELVQAPSDGTVPAPWRVGQMGVASGEVRDTYDGLPQQDGDDFKGMSDKLWSLMRQAPALETYVPLCSSVAGTRHCEQYPVGNYYSPVSGLPPVIEIPVTPRTIRQPHIYGECSAENGLSCDDICKQDAFPRCFYSSQNPLIFKAHDMDGHRLSLYQPGVSSETLFNKTARCWNGDMDEIGLWDPQRLTGVNPRFECFGGTNHRQQCCPAPCVKANGCPCSKANDCPDGHCRPAWAIKMCTHSEFALAGTGKPLPLSILGKNCSEDSECSGTNAAGEQVDGRCEATWSLCREQFDMDRSGEDVNRAGFLLKLDYDWIDQNDLGSKEPGFFARSGWKVQEGTTHLDEPHSVFMQHVVGVSDMPFLDVDNPLDYTAADKKARDKVMDHISASASLRDESLQSKLATAATASALTQQIFATFPCYSGTRNAPPEFFSSSSPGRSATRTVKTDYVCERTKSCFADLHIIDYVMTEEGNQDGFKRSTDEIEIEAAFGTGALSQGQLTNLQVNNEPTTQCKGTGSLSCRFTLLNDYWDSAKGEFREDAVGSIVVKCFVGVDKHDDATCAQGAGSACTCRSLPLCIKFKIVGAAPAFVAPTPLAANSLDDRGTLVPGRTDVAACEGHELRLPLVATDADPGDAVRIFVQDLDVNHLMYSNRMDPYRASGGLYNSDFFDAGKIHLPANCGKFMGYNASRVGDNSGQLDLSPSNNISINGPYKPEIVFKKKPEMEVVYWPRRAANNGIDVHSQIDSCKKDYTGKLRCREKLANMDQVICAYAYDNSRRHGRWVGSPDPNGDDLQVWQRDHSNGDMVSSQHCWRIVMQSPPSFITDPDGEVSPFAHEWIQTTSIYTPTSGEEGYRVEAAFKRVYMAVNQTRTIKFVAQDPQAKDSVSIMLLEDPGIINNMRLGRSLCVARYVDDDGQGEGLPMCRISDEITPGLYPDEPWKANLIAASRSKCSRAERSIEYTALSQEAGMSAQSADTCATRLLPLVFMHAFPCICVFLVCTYMYR